MDYCEKCFRECEQDDLDNVSGQYLCENCEDAYEEEFELEDGFHELTFEDEEELI